MNIEIIKAFLAMFGDPGVFLFPEWDWPKFNGTYWTLEDSLHINEQSGNAVWFTPNWNLGHKNIVGEPIHRSKWDEDKYVSALYIDLDKRQTEYQDVTDKEYEKYVLSVIDQHNLRIQYAVKTWDGWHLYMFIKPECRAAVWEILDQWDNFKNVICALSELFIWWDKASHHMTKLLRLPGSKYWKTPVPKDIKLYRTVKDENGKHKFIECTKPEDCDLWLYDIFLTNTLWIQDFLANMKDVKPRSKKTKTPIYSAMTTQIDQLNIVEVINRIEKYPREVNWSKIVFKTSWDCIYFVKDWQRINTDGYKINREKNYVHNFSFDNHPISERPRWGVFTFLYYYFDNDMEKMWNFLKEEFNIDFTDGWKKTYMKIPADKGLILFQDDWVYYHKITTKDWQNIDVNLKLFNEPMIIKWILRTTFDKLWETENNITYTIINLLNRDEDILISYQEDRKKFNKVYWKNNWLMFLQWEFDLIDFYDAIERATRTNIIREYSHIYLNWYYKEWYVLWEKVFQPNWEEKEIIDEPIVIDTQTILHIPITKEKEVWQYWEQLRTVFTDRECMLAYVTFIALLMWDKFWKPALGWDWQQIILPWLFMSGITKSGKSTMVNLLLNWFGLSWDCRKYSIKGTTLQPLKQSATDDFILHREEFTWDIWNDKETIVRDVLNKTKTARWLMDWTNNHYIYRSSLIIDWEQLPESESVVNRCVTIPFMLEDRIGTQQLLRAFVWVWYRKDFIKKLYEIDVNTVKSDFEKAQDRCIANWIQDRYSMMYAFLLCVNNWFNIYVEDELIKAIKENFEQFNTINSTLTPFAKLLSDMIDTKKVWATLSNTEDWWWIAILPIPTDEFAKRQADIMWVLKKYWRKHISIRGCNMIITVWDLNNEDDVWKDLFNYIILYAGKMRRVNYLDINNPSTFS